MALTILSDSKASDLSSQNNLSLRLMVHTDGCDRGDGDYFYKEIKLPVRNTITEMTPTEVEGAIKKIFAEREKQHNELVGTDRPGDLCQKIEGVYTALRDPGHVEIFSTYLKNIADGYAYDAKTLKTVLEHSELGIQNTSQLIEILKKEIAPEFHGEILKMFDNPEYLLTLDRCPAFVVSMMETLLTKFPSQAQIAIQNAGRADNQIYSSLFKQVDKLSQEAFAALRKIYLEPHTKPSGRLLALEIVVQDSNCDAEFLKEVLKRPDLSSTEVNLVANKLYSMGIDYNQDLLAIIKTNQEAGFAAAKLLLSQNGRYNSELINALKNTSISVSRTGGYKALRFGAVAQAVLQDGDIKLLDQALTNLVPRSIWVARKELGPLGLFVSPYLNTLSDNIRRWTGLMRANFIADPQEKSTKRLMAQLEIIMDCSLTEPAINRLAESKEPKVLDFLRAQHQKYTEYSTSNSITSNRAKIIEAAFKAHDLIL